MASSNTAVGFHALNASQTGGFSTAVGFKALGNSTQQSNDAFGYKALGNNTTGAQNVAVGDLALFNNQSGNNNVALGYRAGLQATGDNNVYIGTYITGHPGESNTCYIRSIFGQTTSGGVPVLIDGDNKLGTTTSSKRFKEEIRPMGTSSEAVLALRPVTFRYKHEIDPAGISQFGLVAEDVEKINRDLVVRDNEGKPYSVRYDQVNAMLLNEFLKEHRRVKELEATVAQQRKDSEATAVRQQKQIEALTAGLQKVSAQLELSKSAQQVAENNQ